MSRARPTINLTGTQLPDAWLFTDERLGGGNRDDPLWRAIARLPRGAGIIFRHYGWSEPKRRALLAKIAREARRRRLFLVGSNISKAPDGLHRSRMAGRTPGRGIITASAHNRRELLHAFQAGANLVFLSPVFATHSHPDARVLGPVRFGLALRGAPGPVLALGGMTARRDRRLRQMGASGFGAIDFWAS